MPYKINIIGLGLFTNPTNALIIDCINPNQEYNIKPDYGDLYNWFAVSDVRNIANVGWHVITNTERYNLLQVYYTLATAGGQLKEVGTNHWLTPNTGATNNSGLGLKGTGERNQNGSFTNFKLRTGFHVSDNAAWLNYYYASYNSNGFALSNAEFTKNAGLPIILVKDSTLKANGTRGIYIGNDGTQYETAVINGIEYTAQYLIESKYRNGDIIPEVKDNATWSSISYGAKCHINNDKAISTFSDKPALLSIKDIEVIGTNRNTGEKVLLNINNHVINISYNNDGVTSIITLNQFISCTYNPFFINATIDTAISELFDPNIYSTIQIISHYQLKDQNGIIINNYDQSLTDSPSNLFFESTGISKSKSNIINIDTMTLNDFKEVAARRLKTEVHRIRIDTKVINFENEGGAKQIDFVEIDNVRTHAYVKNIESFFTGEDADNKIQCFDNYRGENTLVYNHDPADKHFKGCNFFADQLILDGICQGQVIVYTAEKLV